MTNLSDRNDRKLELSVNLESGFYTAFCSDRFLDFGDRYLNQHLLVN
ncbi:hypothetical protein IQ230_17090 [Gloeocapsopsis crepidinum LEGE 06123]|uniref:Uncharacterized protein n=1 Tax=Gloeocapsopsis crepidinum LEGE 06123 TaxID=588587 RepID=A0ABR9UUS7_9CHRO|nr:hypothetical protein [Gloeocapsopsis crepidinum]MBE9192036.1 hypothetical protein [Gloeocapsopsis crepidinum LEGE 06123]